MPNLYWSDVVEILIIAFLVYHMLLWMKNTRAWVLLRGIVVLAGFVILAAVFNMSTILWIVQNVMSIAVVAIVIILQPELRNAIEELGQRNFLSSLLRLDDSHDASGRFSDNTITEIIKACQIMGRARTGALIVIEQTTPLQEYERNGIDLDARVSSQLLVNIFEKNTPLHDGAVIIRGDRITSATCYLPLSDNRLDKTLGTRHRAAVGVSEVSDSLTFIVSEETGEISMAYRGVLYRDVDADRMRSQLVRLQDKETQERRRRILPRRGRSDEETK